MLRLKGQRHRAQLGAASNVHPSPVLYLHGFCSGSGSAKGTMLAERFSEIGVTVVRPDLDGGDFLNTTISLQLETVNRLVRRLRPALVVGSSLGGYLAALHASRAPRTCNALVLIAPAFDFYRRLTASIGQNVEIWERCGVLDFFHYRIGQAAPLGHAFYRDAARHEALPVVQVPTTVFHGRDDEVVPPEVSEQFASQSPRVDLQLLEADHGMLGAAEEIWSGVQQVYRTVATLER